MTVLDAIKGRFSVRKYLDKPIGETELYKVLDAARFSQSAKNFQDWRFIVIRNNEMKHKMVPAAKNQSFIAEASAIIVCCGINIDYVMTCGQHTYNIDVAIAMENMSLTAHELGLGTCWIGAFYEEQVKKLLGIPEDGVRVVGMLTIGYPDAKAPVKNRLLLETIVKYEKW